MSRTIVVLDTTSLLAKIHMYLRNVDIYVSSRVVDEVKDMENRSALELGLDIGRVNIEDPVDEVREYVRRKARELGEHVSLSETDIDVAALAYMLRSCGNVIVFTDDYSLQNLLMYIGISFKPLRTIGIKNLYKYRVYCSKCGYISMNSEEEYCPICGSKLSKRKI